MAFKYWFTREALTIAVVDGWPYWSPAAVAVIGFVQGFPLFYIAIGTMFAAAMAMHLAVKFSEWREVNQVAHKLLFSNVRVTSITDEDGRAVAFRLGSAYQSRATFPITVKLDQLFTVIRRTSGEKLLAGHDPTGIDRVVIDPGALCWFDDHAIEMGIQKGGTSYIGEVCCSFLYGKSESRLECKLEIKKRFMINVNESGYYQGHSDAYDA